jgi:cysteine-rich repeat protein
MLSGRMLRLLAPPALVLGGCFFQENVDDTADSVFPSPPSALCQDGKLEGAEERDDGNATSGDGCAATCEAELPVTIAKTTLPPVVLRP